MVEVIAWVAAGLAIVVWSISRIHKQRVVFDQVCAELAECCGLATTETGVCGPVQGIMLEYDRCTVPSGENSRVVYRLRVALGPTGRWPDQLRLKKEHSLSGLTSLMIGRDLTTGDRDFDLRVDVRGTDLRSALELLQDPIRDRIKQLVGVEGCVADDGYLTREWEGGAPDGREVFRCSAALVGFGRSLFSLPHTPSERLAAAALKSRSAPYRLRALEVLCQTATPAARQEVCEEALDDRDPNVRLLAAEVSRVPKACFVAAELLANSLLDADGVRRAAARLVDATTLDSDTRHLLGSLTPDADGVISAGVAAALPALTKQKIRPAPALMDRILRADDDALRAHSAGLWTVIGGDEGVRGLHALLRDDSSAVQAAACHGLGQIGGCEDVEVLLPLTSGAFRSNALKSAARAAVAAIQAQLSDSHGGLSVISVAGAIGGEDAAGGLSEVSDDS